MAGKKGGVAFEIGGSDPGGSGLQARFERFRKDRVHERRLQRGRVEKAGAQQTRTPEVKAKLRVAFVERALSYVGAPYHRKYFPDLPEDTLFLDCCGLVRKVLRDLAPDFGFTVGGHNQAYQLDTLPIACSREDLVPGDLIFWSGDFLDPTKKAYKNNCVHIEVYLGSRAQCQEKLGLDVPQLEGVLGGNATLGSRTAGHVQVHATFENKPSTQYKINDVFFRSIETWLDGICEPREFQWGTSVPVQSGACSKSVFADEDAESDNEDRKPAGDKMAAPVGGKMPASVGGS